MLRKDEFSAIIHERMRRGAQEFSNIEAKLLHKHEFAIGTEPSRSWFDQFLILAIYQKRFILLFVQNRFQTLIDSSHIITFCISISVIIYGSFKSLNIDTDNELLQNAEQELTNTGEH